MLDNQSHDKIPFDQGFCTRLEYHLGETFENSGRQDLKGFWCDGVSCDPITENQLGKKSVNDTRQIVTKAWIGRDGQTEYEMVIRFGKYSLRRYAKGTDMTDCIPSSGTMEWIDIDTEKKKIIVTLR